MTSQAQAAIAGSDVLVGYSTYIKLLGGMARGKEVICSGMTHEVERAHQAIKKALGGNTVSIISSGDPGVYGMAGIVLELLNTVDAKRIALEIVPGIMSAASWAHRS